MPGFSPGFSIAPRAIKHELGFDEAAGTLKTCSVQIILQVQNLSSSGIKQAGTELMTVTDSEALNNHKIGFYELLIQANGLPTFMLYPSGTAAPQPSW